MQFRERRRVIQVIRTTHDPELKRGRSDVVGKIDKSAPAITDKLRNACSPEEQAEIATYLANRQTTLSNEAVHAGAETLPARMRAAAAYFRTHGDEKAGDFAVEIRAAWDDLKSAMRKAGFPKSKVKKKGGGKGKEKAAAPPPPKADAAVIRAVDAMRPVGAAAEVTATETAAAETVPSGRRPAAKKPNGAKAGEKKPAAAKRSAAKRSATAPVALAAGKPAPAVTVDASAVDAGHAPES